tara:strand:- start:1040 stop:2188 length:1149 start_codon:yes stop_codon:yes gene_type:complete
MVKRKTKKVRSTKKSRLSLDEMYYGPEPSGVDYFEKEGNSLHSFFSWYNYMWDRKQTDLVVIQYAKEHGYKNASKFKKLYVQKTVAYIIRGIENGLVFPDHNDFPNESTAGWQKHLHKELSEYNKKAIDLLADNLDTTKLVKKRLTVQENMDNKVMELLGEVDYAIDIWDCQKFDMYKYLTDNKTSSAVASRIPEQYQEMVDEITEAMEGKDEQLKEGYSHMNKGEKKAFLTFVKKIISDTNRYTENNKPIRKPRKAKQYTATKLVEKLSYLDHDPVNQVKSIDPTKIISAKQLWLFNSKTNEIIKYDQIDRGGLSVKGTTLQNYNPKTSSSKKLGVKTEQVINRILEGGTITLNKCMSEINSKASEVTGRINNNMIILKVD